jgi:4-amino-4-deoxy-L-arabinose transferase-like glycosyltransferase
MLLAGLGQLALMQPDEGRNATVAREMKESGNWLVPTFNGLAYLDKPAMFFKCSGLAMSAFGESETTARLPSALAGLALLALVYAFCRCEFGMRCAALAVIVTATTPLYFIFARLVIMDMMLAFFVSGAIFAGYQAEEREGISRVRWYLLGAAAAGLGTLVKGPVGFILPVLVLLIFNLIERRHGAWKRLFSPWNFVVFFAIALPWFIGLSRARPDFPYYGLMLETLGRFTSNIHRREEPIYFYPLVIAGTFLAWSILLPESAWAMWRARRNLARAERLCVVWAAVVVVFFSLSHSKMPGYILTVAVALGIVTSRVFERALDGTDGPAARIIRRATGALLAMLLLIWGLVLLVVARPDLAAKLSAGHSSEVREYVVSSSGLAISVGLLAFLAALGLWKRRPLVEFAAFALLPLAVTIPSFGALKQYAEARSARVLAAWIKSLPSGTDVACYQCFPSSLPFYLKRSITVLDDTGGKMASNYVLYSLKRMADWPAIIVRQRDWENWLRRPGRKVCLIATRQERLISLAQSHGVPVVEIVPDYWAVQFPVSDSP